MKKIFLCFFFFSLTVERPLFARTLCDLLSSKDVERVTEISPLRCEGNETRSFYCLAKEQNCKATKSVVSFMAVPTSVAELDKVKKDAKESSESMAKTFGSIVNPRIQDVNDLGVPAVYYGLGRSLQWVFTEGKGFGLLLGDAFTKNDDATQRAVLVNLGKAVNKKVK